MGACLLAAGAAGAEPEAQLRVARAPYLVGVPIDVHVYVTGLERDPEPSCSVDPPQQGTLQLVGVAPNFSSSIQIVGGRVVKSESATYTCQFQFSASQPGIHRIGPFHVSQGAVVLDTPPYSLKLQEIPEDPQLRVRVELPREPVYIGQHLPITIEWWVDEKLQDRIAGYSIQSELFMRDELFRFTADEEPGQGQQTLDIETANGGRRLKASVEQRSEAGRRFLVVSARRTLIPLRAGEFRLAPTTLNVEEVTDWRRDLFGGRRAAGTKRLFSRDEERVLRVRAAPLDGRPASFAGAVGRGFSLEVAADRSVVQLGDPITLTLSVRGEGNLEGAGLPPLDVDGGLSREHFRLPEEDPPGEIKSDAKVFRVSLRVLDDSVREIPDLAYSWFDPELGAYQTSRSRPIALSVRPAQVISAADVIAGSAPQIERSSETAADEDARAGEARGSFSLTGADLSIEQDRERLLQRPGSARALQLAAYGGSFAVLLGAAWLRRRADVSPELLRRREVYARQRKRIAAARAAAPRHAPAELAAALREMVAVAPALRSEELDRFLQECDDVIYAPEASRVVDPGALAARAEALADAMKARLA